MENEKLVILKAVAVAIEALEKVPRYRQPQGDLWAMKQVLEKTLGKAVAGLFRALAHQVLDRNGTRIELTSATVTTTSGETLHVYDDAGKNGMTAGTVSPFES